MIESHPDNAFEDLRLDRPFPGLVQYLKSMDMSKMTKQVGARTDVWGYKNLHFRGLIRVNVSCQRTKSFKIGRRMEKESASRQD